MLGITAIFVAVPAACVVLKVAGALYLLYLAWTVVRPGAQPLFEVRDLPRDPPRRLIGLGLVTNVNGLFVIVAGSLAVVLARRPAVARAQRWLMGTVLASFGAKLLADRSGAAA